MLVPKLFTCLREYTWKTFSHDLVAGVVVAALGAEVLRVDPPRIPELPVQHLDTGPGKRAAP